MKFSKLFVFLVLIFAIVSAADARKGCRKGRAKKSFSIKSTWGKHYKRRAKRSEKWDTTIQTYHDGCEDAYSQYEGDANALGATVMNSFRQYLSILLQCARFNGTVLAGNTPAILDAMSKADKLSKSSLVVLVESDKVYLDISNDIKNVILKLREHIGSVAEIFADAVDEFSSEASKYMRRFLKTVGASGCQKRVNIEPMLQKLQKLMNLVAIVADTLLKGPDATDEVQHSVLLISMILWYFQIVSQGVHSSALDIQIRDLCEISENIKSLSQSFDKALLSTDKIFSSEVVTIVKTMKSFLAGFVEITSTLNTELGAVFSEFDAGAIDVEEIAWNLFKSPKVSSIIPGENVTVAEVQ